MLVRFDHRAALVALAAVLGSLIAAPAAELDAKAVQIKTPDQFKWRDPSMRAPNNAVLLGDAAQAGSLFVHINSFVPGKFGEAHYHPNDRYVLVVDGAPWRGTGNVVDPAHATRVPKGTFMIEQAGKVHWDGTKDESGAYFIIEIPPSGQTPAPKEQGPWHGGDPSAAKIIAPSEIPWQGARHNEHALLAGDPSKPGVYVMMSRWPTARSAIRISTAPTATSTCSTAPGGSGPATSTIRSISRCRSRPARSRPSSARRCTGPAPGTRTPPSSCSGRDRSPTPRSRKRNKWPLPPRGGE